MKIRITSVASSGAGEALANITVRMEDSLNEVLADRSYGGEVDQFIVVAVAVDSDTSENGKFCRGYDKVGSYKHPLTQSRVKFISFALPFDPAIIEAMLEEDLRQALCVALLNRLRSPGLKIPKAFDYEKFMTEVSPALEVYRALST